MLFWIRQSLAWIDGSQIPSRGKAVAFLWPLPDKKIQSCRCSPARATQLTEFCVFLREKTEPVTDPQMDPILPESVSCSNYNKDLFDRGVNMDEAGKAGPF